MNRMNPNFTMDYLADAIAHHAGEVPVLDHFAHDPDVRRHGRHEVEPAPHANPSELGAPALKYIDANILMQAAVPSAVDMEKARRYRDQLNQ